MKEPVTIGEALKLLLNGRVIFEVASPKTTYYMASADLLVVKTTKDTFSTKSSVVRLGDFLNEKSSWSTTDKTWNAKSKAVAS